MTEYDDWVSCGYDNVSIKLEEWKVIKETPKGYWINRMSGIWWGGKRWVSKTSRKRFAYPTKEEALESFLIRKKAHIKHLKRNLTNAEKALELAKNWKDD